MTDHQPDKSTENSAQAETNPLQPADDVEQITAAEEHTPQQLPPPLAPRDAPPPEETLQGAQLGPLPASPSDEAPTGDPNLTPGESGLPTVNLDAPDDVKPLIRYGDVLLSDVTRLRLRLGKEGELGTIESDIQHELIAGRAIEGQPYKPDIDLTPYNAYQYGVSRYHLKIERRGDTLYVTDLGSQNGTYLNGVRMYPNQARVLRDTDELLLGRLPVTVRLVGAEPSEL